MSQAERTASVQTARGARSLQAQGGCDAQRRRDRQATASISGFTLRTRGRSQETLGWGGSPGNGPRSGALHAGDLLSCDCGQVGEAGPGRGRRVFTQRTRRRVLLEAVGLGWPFSVFPSGGEGLDPVRRRRLLSPKGGYDVRARQLPCGRCLKRFAPVGHPRSPPKHRGGGTSGTPSLRHTSGLLRICSSFNSPNNSPTWALLCPF